MHNRTRIRQALFQYLHANLEGLKVYSGRRLALKPSDLPFVCIYTDEEHHELFSNMPKVMKNKLDLVLEVIVSGLGNLDDLLDEHLRQIENLICVFDPLQLDLITIQPKSTHVQYSTQGETLMGSLRLTYEVIYISEWVIAA